MEELAPSKMSDVERKVFDDIDEVISRAVTIGDPMIAFEYGSLLKRRQALEGLALAKLLYRLRESWDMFKVSGIDDDLITMADLHMGVSPATTKKYLDLWEKVFENPEVTEDIKNILSGRPIGELLLLTAAVGEGQLAGDELKEAALSPSKAELKAFIQKARGKRTSANSAIMILLNMQDRAHMKAGTLYAKQGNKRIDIGTLDILLEDELAQKAIARLKNSAGVQEVWK